MTDPVQPNRSDEPRRHRPDTADRSRRTTLNQSLDDVAVWLFRQRTDLPWDEVFASDEEAKPIRSQAAAILVAEWRAKGLLPEVSAPTPDLATLARLLRAPGPAILPPEHAECERILTEHFAEALHAAAGAPTTPDRGLLASVVADLLEHADGNIGHGCWELHDKYAALLADVGGVPAEPQPEHIACCAHCKCPEGQRTGHDDLCMHGCNDDLWRELPTGNGAVPQDRDTRQ